jgi:hypothetical protein
MRVCLYHRGVLHVLKESALYWPGHGLSHQALGVLEDKAFWELLRVRTQLADG